MSKQLPEYKDGIESLKPFSRIKLIVLDLDGTLVQSSSENVPDKVLILGRSLKSHNFNTNITIATGRALSGISGLLYSLPIKSNYPIILYNGSLVLTNKIYEPIFKKSISNEMLTGVLSYAKRFNVSVLAYYFELFNKETVLGWTNNNKPVYDYNGLEILWQHSFSNENIINGEPSMLVINTSSESEKNIEDLLVRLRTMEGISVSRGGAAYIEVKPIGINKGVALEHIAGLLELKRNEILALGDNDNDVEMLSWAGIGVAVKNASISAKRASDYTTRNEGMGGASEVMQLVREARKLLRQNKSIHD